MRSNARSTVDRWSEWLASKYGSVGLLSSPDNPLELEQAQTYRAGEKPQIQGAGVLALKQEVQARLIHTSVILANTRTLEVCRLDEDAVHYWQALCSQATWPQVFTFFAAAVSRRAGRRDSSLSLFFCTDVGRPGLGSDPHTRGGGN